ncbi:MAG: 5'/3'-nucleotidase SurE [Phycisphaerae bacterium]|nr:5'/3'-nucleotidase SurE [Phycisphaerae bacterium]
MHILLTNDDGLFAPGLAAMYRRLTQLGHVTVVAPAQPKSGASHSISLEPLVCEKLDLMGKFTALSVEGSPADCVKVALSRLADDSHGPVDLVVSGINHGANVGVHVFYSGTVAAAVEAAFEAVPSIAVSAVCDEHFDIETASDYGFQVIRQLLPLHPGDVVNINVPSLTDGNPKGIVVVPQSIGGFEENFTISQSHVGQIVFEYAGGRHRDPHVTPADTSSLRLGYITVTALHFDMTHYERNKLLAKTAWKLKRAK